MREMVRICGEKELPREGKVCEMAGGRLCVAKVKGEIVVMDNRCPHQGGPLGQGFVEKGRVVCPFHAWAFDVKTGEAQHDPRGKVRIYESAVKDGSLIVRPPELPAQ